VSAAARLLEAVAEQPIQFRHAQEPQSETTLITSKENSTIIDGAGEADGAGDADAIQARIKQIKAQIEEPSSD
jgi:uncharacterized protein YmfQ (DUF2313 family)